MENVDIFVLPDNQPANRKVASLIPRQGTAWVALPIDRVGFR